MEKYWKQRYFFVPLNMRFINQITFNKVETYSITHRLAHMECPPMPDFVSKPPNCKVMKIAYKYMYPDASVLDFDVVLQTHII